MSTAVLSPSRTCPATGRTIHLAAERLIKVNAVVAVVSLLVGAIAALLLVLTRWQAVHLLPAVWYYRLLGVHGMNIVPGKIEAQSVNGGVEFELASPLDATDSVQLETVNGGAELSLPHESKATITARCVNGGVKVEGLDISKEEQSNDFEKRRRLNGTMNGGGAHVTLSTTNGGIRLYKIGSKTS